MVPSTSTTTSPQGLSGIKNKEDIALKLVELIRDIENFSDYQTEKQAIVSLLVEVYWGPYARITLS